MDQISFTLSAIDFRKSGEWKKKKKKGKSGEWRWYDVMEDARYRIGDR